MTIYEVKYRVVNAPHFFDSKTMKFFGQTLKDFSVKKIGENKYHICAPSRYGGKVVGYTERIFNATTNCLESIPYKAG